MDLILLCLWVGHVAFVLFKHHPKTVSIVERGSSESRTWNVLPGPLWKSVDSGTICFTLCILTPFKWTEHLLHGHVAGRFNSRINSKSLSQFRRAKGLQGATSVATACLVLLLFRMCSQIMVPACLDPSCL